MLTEYVNMEQMKNTIVQKFFVAHELWAGKNSFSTYVCYSLDVLFWLAVYMYFLLKRPILSVKVSLVDGGLFCLSFGLFYSQRKRQRTDAQLETFASRLPRP